MNFLGLKSISHQCDFIVSSFVFSTTKNKSPVCVTDTRVACTRSGQCYKQIAEDWGQGFLSWLLFPTSLWLQLSLPRPSPTDTLAFCLLFVYCSETTLYVATVLHKRSWPLFTQHHLYDMKDMQCDVTFWDGNFFFFKWWCSHSVKVKAAFVILSVAANTK